MVFKAVVDRVEEDKGVLLLLPPHTGRIIWPSRYLPQGAKEGAVVRLEATLDEEATARARNDVANLIGELLKREGLP